MPLASGRSSLLGSGTSEGMQRARARYVPGGR